jgi:CheY-like chemotaxis protein
MPIDANRASGHPNLGQAPRDSPSSTDFARRPIKVVLAEDERELLVVFSNILSRSGISVIRTFENGKDLVEFVTTNSDSDLEPDVVITDLRMPVIDGIEAAKKIRAAKPWIKIILASAYEVPAAGAEWFHAILKKPFSRKDLIEAVTSGLESS